MNEFKCETEQKWEAEVCVVCVRPDAPDSIHILAKLTQEATQIDSDFTKFICLNLNFWIIFNLLATVCVCVCV